VPLDETKWEYVGFWVRVAASVIDTVLALVVITPIAILLLGRDGALGLKADLSPAGVLVNYVLPAVAIVWFWVARQATPGKMVFGARIVDADTGGPLSVRQSLGRYLGYYVSIFGFFLGFAWVAFDARKQGWHDKLAGTVVVRARR
jgi:uncharacterized RDD family membrane protein YckC